MMRKKWKRNIAIMLVMSMLLTMWMPVKAATTEWEVQEDTNIFWVSTPDSQISDENLKEQVKLFNSELAAKVTSAPMKIQFGEKELAKEHDIILTLDSSLSIPKEGYVIKAADGLEIQASDDDGLFYGCRYVIQSLILKNGLTIGSTITNSPDGGERGLLLDMGRKYYSKDWIINLIKEMSWSNLNTIQLHFSEEMGMRLESKRYPWLAGSDSNLCIVEGINDVDKGKYLTQQEMREIGEIAKLYHVDIIPSFDSPGHMNYIVKRYNEYTGSDIGNYFHYNGKKSIVKGTGGAEAQKYSRGIDISNEEAVEFVKNLVTEYATFFKELGCSKFDIGGDELLGWGSAVVSTSTASRWQQLDHWKEYAIERTGNNNAVAYDAFLLYMNDLESLLKDLGYESVRMWNDDAYRTADTGYKGVVKLSPTIEIEYWQNGSNSSKNTIDTYLEHNVYNYLNVYNYYVLKENTSYAGANAKSIYTEWNPFYFVNKTVDGANSSKIKGSAFCIWSDNPSFKTASAVLADVLPMIRANGAKAWDKDINKTVTYSTYNNRVSLLGSVPGNLPVSPEVEEVKTVDISKLMELIDEYNSIDKEKYTQESFKEYENSIVAGEKLIASVGYTQEMVDEICGQIETAKLDLREKISINPNLKLYKATFKAARMTKGKVATLNVLVSTDVVALEIYDDFGNKVVFDSQCKTTAKTSIENSVFIRTMFHEYNKGTRTYTIYAIDAEGNRSAESIQASILVR